MSSSGGVGGGSAPVVLDQGMIQFNGETIDPRVAAELEKVTSEISGAPRSSGRMGSGSTRR